MTSGETKEEAAAHDSLAALEIDATIKVSRIGITRPKIGRIALRRIRIAARLYKRIGFRKNRDIVK
jgi:hypothetical protein